MRSCNQTVWANDQPVSPFPVAEALLNDYGAQIEKTVRFFNYQAPTLALATIDNKKGIQ